tara:strand:+ start:163 stop:720 length:558 start_codon:yes stop_codon:yes gene_type:complete
MNVNIEMPSTKKPEDIDIQSEAGSEIVKTKRRRGIYYTSNIPDSYIVNAANGHVYPYKVGSFESLQLYKVMDATGNVDKNGLKVEKMMLPNNTSNTLYYDNPEEFMRHRRIKLDQDKINTWNKKVKRLFSKGEFDKNEWIKMKQEKVDKSIKDFEEKEKINTKKTHEIVKRRRANSGMGIGCMRN